MISRAHILIPLVALALMGAHCRSNPPSGPLNAPGSEKKAAAALPSDGLSEEEAARLLPGIDTSMMTPRQRASLQSLASDTFCPCAPVTVAGCLRQGPECRPAVRLVELAKKLLMAGQGEAHALLRVEAYYNSFPSDRRREVEPKGPAKGADAEQARVTIVEFSDFQCPACRAAHPNLSALAKKYPDDVRVVFRHFPLRHHEHSHTTAMATAYAAEQGRFWEFADRAFERQADLSEATLKSIAREVGLDPEAMWTAIHRNPKYDQLVEADRAAGASLQISGTPSIFVNGRPFLLPPTEENLAWTVEDELEWLAHGGTWASK